MAMVRVDGSLLQMNSQCDLFILVWGFAATWRWVCIH